MNRQRNKRMIKAILPFAAAILIGLAIGTLVKKLLHPAIVNGISMMPTYMPQGRFFLTRYAAETVLRLEAGSLAISAL